MMNVTDITQRQFDTLVLVRTMEEFIDSRHEHLADLRGVVWNFEESLSDKGHKQYVEDICKLTQHGYLVSDAAEEHIKEDKVPEVEGITPKGKAVLDEWEQELKQKLAEQPDNEDAAVPTEQPDNENAAAPTEQPDNENVSVGQPIINNFINNYWNNSNNYNVTNNYIANNIANDNALAKVYFDPFKKIRELIGGRLHNAK